MEAAGTDNMSDVDYSIPVYKSLMKRRLTLGIPLIPLFIILLVTVVFFIALETLVMIPFAVLAIMILRAITKKDEYSLEIFLESLLQPDELN